MTIEYRMRDDIKVLLSSYKGKWFRHINCPPVTIDGDYFNDMKRIDHTEMKRLVDNLRDNPNVRETIWR